jgi:hypothetical protein
MTPVLQAKGVRPNAWIGLGSAAYFAAGEDSSTQRLS